MADDKINDSANGGNFDGAGRRERRDFEGSGESSSSAVAASCEVVSPAPGSGASSSISEESSGSRNAMGLADRLADILMGGDCDLLLQQSERESNFLQWLQALDMQVMGACRVDERMKPLLKANSASGVAEDRLLSYLSEHFEAAEVGLLARCLCIPLVSFRVGKIIKHETTLCPTSARGNLVVALLPSSDLRITFIGDDGQTQRIAVVGGSSESTSITVEEIVADKSGRSFFIRVSDAEVFYFWLSEKSKLLGKELLSKMKDLLKRKPTLASLTGISESRLDCFATHLRAYLAGSNGISARSNTTASSTILLDAISDAYGLGQSSHHASTAPAKPSRYRHNGGQAMKTHTLYQSSLSPRSNSFKEGLTRSLSSLRNASRDKLKPRRGDIHFSISSSTTDTSTMNPTSEPSEEGRKFPEATGSNSVSTLAFLESLRNVSLPPILSAATQLPPFSPTSFSPYYCWCPPRMSPSTFSAQLPLPVEAVPLSLPPLTHLLPATRPPSLLATSAMPPLSLAQVPPLDFPSSFAPLMCDPIVHIPVIDVCSSGQGYLVSAGPTAMATALPSLMIPETESVVEKGARETLRLLIGGSSSPGQPSTSFMGILPLPAVLDTDDKPSMFVAGSRGLYCGSSDVDALLSRGLYSGTSGSLLSQGLYSGTSNVDALLSRGLYSGTSDVDVLAKSIAAVSLASRSDSGTSAHQARTSMSGGGVEGSSVGGGDPTFSFGKEETD